MHEQFANTLHVYCGKTCQTADALGRVRVPPSRWCMIFVSRETKYYKFGTDLFAYSTPPAGSLDAFGELQGKILRMAY